MEVLLQVIQRWLSSSLELAREEIPLHEEQGQHMVAGNGCWAKHCSTARLMCQQAQDTGSRQVRPHLRLSLVFNRIFLHGSIS